MKTLRPALLLLALGSPLLPGLAQAAPTNEVLVLTTATDMVPSGQSTRSGVELQNLGPDPIYCALVDSTKAVVGKARRILPGGTWSFSDTSRAKVYCITTVAQVTGAATVVTEGLPP